MLGFMGEYRHTIDKKGRMSIPAKFREDLGEKFILAKGSNGCIFGYSLEEWEQMVTKITTSEDYSKRSNVGFLRKFFSSASEAEIDSMGRVLVSPPLREYADLNDRKEVTVVGVMKRFEIWSTERWESYETENEDDIDIAAGMEIFGI